MSLFKRPAWAAKPVASDDEEEDEKKDIFSHSERTYKTIVADSERRKKEKLDRQKAKAERRSSGKRSSDEVKREASASTPPKRRRINSEDAAKLLGGIGLSSKPPRERSESAGFEEDEEESARIPKRRSPRKNKSSNDFWDEPAPSATGSKSNVIDVSGSSEDEADSVKLPERSKSAAPPVEEDNDDESDEELAEIARQARARRLQQLNNASSTPEATGRISGPGSGTAENSDFGVQNIEQDPAIQLLITSRIANTKPLRVVRKLSQRLQEIRLAWCNKQGFSEDMTQNVYFVHRMRRVYDVTTCRSLGLFVDDNGTVTMRGAEGVDGAENVSLEAVTDEIFAEMKAAQARESLVRSGQFGPDAASGAQDDAAATEEPQEEELIKLVLKGKGREDFKLIVKPTTVFSKIINAYRKKFQLAEDKSLSLEFDGERLEPDQPVSSTDVSDMDCLDVHVS